MLSSCVSSVAGQRSCRYASAYKNHSTASQNKLFHPQHSNIIPTVSSSQKLTRYLPRICPCLHGERVSDLKDRTMVKVTARDLAIFGETNTGGNQSNGGSFTFNGVVDTTDNYRRQRAQCARTYMAGPTCQRKTQPGRHQRGRYVPVASSFGDSCPPAGVKGENVKQCRPL